MSEERYYDYMLRRTREEDNRVSDKERELLIILMEECGEVIQSASKIIRFGNDHSNRASFAKELGDLQAMIDLAKDFTFTTSQELEKQSRAKIAKLHTYSNLYK